MLASDSTYVGVATVVGTVGALATEAAPDSLQAWVVGAVLTALVSVVGFLVKRAFDNVASNLDKLNTAYHELKLEVAVLKERLAHDKHDKHSAS